MNFKEIVLKKAYSSDSDNILYDFYIPALESSVEYKRIAGFFTSASLAVAAKGISGLIKNGGHFLLITSPCLSKEDVQVIINSREKPEKYIEKKMLDELDNMENEFIQDHVYALGWLLANNKLEIRVVIPQDDNGEILSYQNTQLSGLFHQKVGILKDFKGNMISFSGSINETAIGWRDNIEEFKVFRNWEPSEKEYIEADILKFSQFWNNESKKTRTIDIPEAVKHKLIKLAPPEINNTYFNNLYKQPKNVIELFDKQKEAVNSWYQNGMKGIFEMATGTGKTITALGCMRKAYDVYPRLLSVITCPYHHLLEQWKREIEKFGVEHDALMIADSSNPQWRKQMKETLINLSLEYIRKVIILTTHSTFSSEKFMEILKDELNDNFHVLLIGDEVHGLGAGKRRRGLLDKYRIRLGLSATPRRWFDDIGTKNIYDFFDRVVYEFGLKEAISTINPATGETYLTPYYYIPKFVSLSSDELDDYVNETSRIIARLHGTKDDEERDKILELMLFKRANIVKNALNKYRVLENIIDRIGSSSVNWTLIYASPQQVKEIMKIINERSIRVHLFTMDEGVTPSNKFSGLSERAFILEEFAKRTYQILVAMKCLDEGVDVPPVRTAILMASSGNPREYIQRIGRVIRRYPGKNTSTIYDIIVAPSFDKLPQELIDIEWKILEKELKRYEEISTIAINNAEALSFINIIKNKFFEVKK